MNCLIYLRVSTKEQAEGGYSIPAQREACLKLIREKDWTFIDEYVDRGESARSQDRPQLQEMLSRIKKEGNIQAVVVHKIDRLARNLEDHVAIKAILKRCNTTLISVVENIEDSASGRLIEGIHALMAEFYSANLSSEVKKGMLQKAKSGGCTYKAPIGYKNLREAIQGKGFSKVAVDEVMAPLVKEAFELYASGNYSVEEIRDIMEKKGLRGKAYHTRQPRPLTKSSIAYMLANKFFVGVVTFKGVEYPGLHEPIIDRELFSRVQETLRVRDYAGERKRKHPHYLKGTLFCAHCGSRLSYMLAKGKYPYFYCLGQKRNEGCKQPYISVEEAEKAVEKFYEKMQLSKAWTEKLERLLENEIIKRSGESFKERKFHTQKIDELTGKRYKLIEAYYAEAISLDILKEEQNRLNAEIMLHEERLRTLDIRLEQVQKAIGMAIKMAGKSHEAYMKSNPDRRRLFNQAFFTGILFRGNKIEKTQYTELFNVLFSPRSLSKSTLVGPVGFEPTTNGL